MNVIEIGASVPRRRRWLLHRLGKLWLKLSGWRTDIRIPDLPKFVLIGAPHTSNWDFVHGISAVFSADLDIAFYAKHTLFRWPWGGFFRWLGGHPIDRGAAAGVVEQTRRLFEQSDGLIMTLAPEGTRRRVDQWKSGFYHMAVAAQVPIVCGYIDYRTKQAGTGLVIYPSGNYEQDMSQILAFYREVTAAHPENFYCG